jgi:acetyl esterase/lipase
MKQSGLIKMLAAGVICAMALSAASAQDCSPTLQTEQYGTAPDHTKLKWDRYTPTTGGPRWPAIVVIHGGGFRSGARSNVSTQCIDLACAGYLCFAIDYRTCQNRLPSQPSTYDYGSGVRATGVAGPTSDIHDQMDDVRLAITKAKLDGQCTGIVYALGGSAGASHAIFAAIEGDVDRAVGLSGTYDGGDLHGLPPLPSPTPTPTATPSPRPFVQDWEMYTDVGHPTNGDPPPPPDLSDPPIQSQRAAMHAASPVTQPIVADPVPPIFLINGDIEAMPKYQLTDMVTRLTDAGVGVMFTSWPNTSPYQANIISNDDQHSFKNWLVPIAPPDPTTVKDAVIEFFSRQSTSP